MTYSHLEFGKDVLYQGDWAPYFNFSLSPQTPEFTEFQIKNNSDHNESSKLNRVKIFSRNSFLAKCF